jgi:hypothetical protein
MIIVNEEVQWVKVMSACGRSTFCLITLFRAVVSTHSTHSTHSTSTF